MPFVYDMPRSNQAHNHVYLVCATVCRFLSRRFVARIHTAHLLWNVCIFVLVFDVRMVVIILALAFKVTASLFYTIYIIQMPTSKYVPIPSNSDRLHFQFCVANVRLSCKSNAWPVLHKGISKNLLPAVGVTEFSAISSKLNLHTAENSIDSNGHYGPSNWAHTQPHCFAVCIVIITILLDCPPHMPFPAVDAVSSTGIGSDWKCFVASLQETLCGRRCRPNLVPESVWSLWMGTERIYLVMPPIVG